MSTIIKASATQNQLRDINSVFMFCANEFSPTHFMQIIKEIHYQDQLLEMVLKLYPKPYYNSKEIDFFIKRATTTRCLDAIELLIAKNKKLYQEIGGEKLLELYKILIHYRREYLLENCKVNNPIYV